MQTLLQAARRNLNIPDSHDPFFYYQQLDKLYKHPCMIRESRFHIRSSTPFYSYHTHDQHQQNTHSIYNHEPPTCHSYKPRALRVHGHRIPKFYSLKPLDRPESDAGCSTTSEARLCRQRTDGPTNRGTEGSGIPSSCRERRPRRTNQGSTSRSH